MRAFIIGTEGARRDPTRSLAILRKVAAGDRRFLSRATRATLELLSGPHGVGCMRAKQWQRFGAWMRVRRLLTSSIPASAVMTMRFLPARCKS